MTEPQPVITSNKVTKFICSSCEFTGYLTLDGEVSELYLWLDDLGIEVLELVKNRVLKLGDYVVDREQWFEYTTPTPYSIVPDLDSYVRYLQQFVGKHIEGKTLLLSYSGGKDSTAALIILLKLQELVRFRLHVCYVHIPYLEPKINVDYVMEIGKRLGIDIEVLEPPRWIVRKYLMKEGLPYRRSRWCTYLKVRPLRSIRKVIGADFEVTGDRLLECRKRFKRLMALLERSTFISGKEFRPIYPLTIVDIVKICRESTGIVHPQYLRGFSRVSCTYCPYRSTYEVLISSVDEVEDPGLIDSVLRMSYEKWYRDYVDFSDFIRYGLWRYVPKVAKMFSLLRDSIRKEIEKGCARGAVKLGEVTDAYRSIWVKELPQFPTVSIEVFHEFLKKRCGILSKEVTN
ncbi:MAG: hypothetical protein DRJ40_10495 [Thermoprotei archaeon]|mgnify:CR=1 FL=1|nr:MAG: hypothetical protein DRJ40_10495 [Thermoprotei archaeon]